MGSGNLVRTNTEYIGTVSQRNDLDKLGDQYSDAKLRIKKQEAQGLANVFRRRIETECDESFEDWTVLNFTGDCFRSMLAKVQTREARDNDSAMYLHLWVERRGKSNHWDIFIALNKSAEDALDEDDPDLEELDDEERLCAIIEPDSCAVM